MRGSDAGIADGGYIMPVTFHDLLLEKLDSLFSALIVAPLVVSYWRGTWNLSDVYLFPDNKIHSAVASLIIGIVGHLVFTILQGWFRGLFNPNRHRLTFYCGSRLYTSIFGVVCVNCWRGGWQLIDHYTARNMTTLVSVTIFAITALMLLKTLRNVASPPFVVVTDEPTMYFNVPTMYRKSGTREQGLYILDCLFSVLVIGTLVVFVWRGVWNLLVTLYPEDQKTSAWASLVIGYAIVGITFSLQPIMRWACERLVGFWRVIVADVFLFVSFVGTVNGKLSRSQFSAAYIVASFSLAGDLDAFGLVFLTRLLSDWLTHGVSLVLLILLNCSNSVLVRGVYFDAEEPAGQCVVFPVYYIRHFFQKERTKKQERMKKQKRLMETLEKADQNNTAILIEKLHVTSESLERQMSVSILSDDVKSNEFSESDKSNEKIDENGENKVFCDEKCRP